MHAELAATAVRASALGDRAARLLGASGGWVEPLPEFPDAPYGLAAGGLVWVGPAPRVAHPRMVQAHIRLPLSSAVRVETGGARIWRAAGCRPASAQRLCAGLAALCAQLHGGCAAGLRPRGLARLIAGEVPEFPLHQARGRLLALARAYALADGPQMIEASVALLGYGPGLTPSGDDCAGAALFGARWRSRGAADAGASEAALLDTVGATLLAAAPHRTHRLSAALLADLVAGESYSALHELLQALECGLPLAAQLAALGRLAAIGHSSGWDLFAGLALGVLRDPLIFSG
jgi:hypothetical protein